MLPDRTMQYIKATMPEELLHILQSLSEAERTELLVKIRDTGELLLLSKKGGTCIDTHDVNTILHVCAADMVHCCSALNITTSYRMIIHVLHAFKQSIVHELHEE